jgi:drug/metabolite transporter (DMT)-like permease
MQRCLAGAPVAAAAAAAAAAAQQCRSARAAAASSRPPARCAHVPHTPPPPCRTRRRRGGALRAAPPDADSPPLIRRSSGGSEGAPSTSNADPADADAAAAAAADTALGRTLLIAVAAAYGSMTVSLRYVFLLPGPPVRMRIGATQRACTRCGRLFDPRLALLPFCAQTASVLSAARGLIAAACFAPLLWSSRAEAAAAPPAFWRAVGELTLYNCAFQGLLNVAVLYTDATRASFFFQGAIVFTPLLAAASGATVAPATWGGAAAAAAGVALLAADGGGGGSAAAAATAAAAAASSGLGGLAVGDVAALGAALTYSLYVYRMSEFGARGLSTDLTQALKCALLAGLYTAWAGTDLLRALTAAGGGAGAVADAAAAAAESASHIVAPTSLGAAAASLWPGVACASAWGALAYSAVIPGALADVLQARGQAKVPAAEAQVLLAAEPLWTALFGTLLLQERMTPVGWAGAGLVVAALGVASGAAGELAAKAGGALRRAAGGTDEE